MTIRKETASDIEQIWKVNAAAFETTAEADLVNALRESGTLYISLVAEEREEIVGHIFFTPVQLVGDRTGLRLMGLAPMAVVPVRQNQGLGSQLVVAGLKACREQGVDAVVVLGHPHYYPRFGFTPSVKFGIKSEYEVPEELFMVLELKKGVLERKQGTIRYHELFGRA